MEISAYLFIYLFIYFFDLAQALDVGQKNTKFPTRSIHLEPTHNEIKTREIYPPPVTP